MKKATTLIVALALGTLLAQSAFAASPNVRISQVYGGGGGSTGSPTYNVDYVELFNNSGTAVILTGWALEYGSATGNWGSSSGNYLVFPAGASIAACGYLLIQSGTAGSAGGPLPITPDYTSPANMSATSGKVGLFNALNANVACGSEVSGTLVDKVAYGTSNCPEGTAVAALSTTTGAVRNGGGTTDTDNNSSDFTVVSGPVPRNSSSPKNSTCLATPANTNTWGQLKLHYR